MHILEFVVADWFTLQRLRCVSSQWKEITNNVWMKDAEERKRRWQHVAITHQKQNSMAQLDKHLLREPAPDMVLQEALHRLRKLPAFAPPVLLPHPLDLDAQRRVCRHWMSTLHVCLKLAKTLPCLNVMRVEFELFQRAEEMLDMGIDASRMQRKVAQLHNTTMCCMHTLCDMTVQVVDGRDELNLSKHNVLREKYHPCPGVFVLFWKDPDHTARRVFHQIGMEWEIREAGKWYRALFMPPWTVCKPPSVAEKQHQTKSLSHVLNISTTITTKCISPHNQRVKRQRMCY